MLLALSLLPCTSADAGTAALCGNGVRDGSERCDDGNTFDDDCCTATCTFAPANPKCGIAVELEPDAQAAGPFANYVAGWEFTPTSPLTVVGLGVYDRELDGFVDVHDVGIWLASGTLLTSSIVPSLTTAPLVGRFRYVPVAPLALQPGQTYVVAALYHQSVIEWFAEGGDLTFDPRLSVVAGREQYQVPGLALPSQTVDEPRFGPSMLLVGECGDGVVDGGEECDDANATPGDGCSTACVFDGPTPTPTPTVTPTPTDTPLPCAGDCDRSGIVDAADVRLAVDIALGRSPIDDCDVADTDHSGQLTVEELVGAVVQLLGVCGLV